MKDKNNLPWKPVSELPKCKPYFCIPLEYNLTKVIVKTKNGVYKAVYRYSYLTGGHWSITGIRQGDTIKLPNSRVTHWKLSTPPQGKE